MPFGASSSRYRATLALQSDLETMNLAGGDHQVLYRTGGGMADSQSVERDPRARDDMQAGPVIPTDYEANYSIRGGDVPLGWHLVQQMLMLSPWTPEHATTAAAGDITTVSATNKIVGPAAKLDPVDLYTYVDLTGLAGVTLPGGAPAARPQGYVIDKSSGELVIDPNSLVLADEAMADGGKVVMGEWIAPGNTPQVATLEERFSNGDWQLWYGLIATAWNWNRSEKGQLSVDASLMSVAGLPNQGAVNTASSLVGLPTTPAYGRAMTHRHVSLIRRGSGLVTLPSGTMSIQAQRDVQGIPDAGTLGDASKVLGDISFNLGLNLTVMDAVAAVAELHDLIQKFKAGEPTELSWGVGRTATDHVYRYRAGASVFTQASREAGEPSRAMTLQGQAQAEPDEAAGGRSLLIQHFNPVS